MSKSGSPAPKLMTSRPLARRAAALAETASVGDGSIERQTAGELHGRLLLSGLHGLRIAWLRVQLSIAWNRRASEAATEGGTIRETSPPINATSLTSDEDT